ncbi:ATP-binding protein [Mesorhizobium sp. CN5-321]|jgi:signal transduction histidine kinase|uniref:sensor histidine kinase n=1 Tax=Mesorhizobium hunchu TaxID=3157708 RepID=UPI0032B72563
MPQLEPTKPFLSAYAEEATALKRRSLLESAAVAHELGNLIQIASSAVNIIARSSRFDVTPTLEPVISGARTSLERAGILVRQSLHRAERDPSDVGHIDVAQAVAEIADLIRPTWAPTHRIALDVGAVLPAVKCEPLGLQSAILNLALNARDSMPNGGTITITAAMLFPDDDKTLVELSVADCGIGMTDETMKRAFDPFFTTKSGGLGGVGLPMVKRFVEGAGGQIRLSSMPGAGTTVTLFLPAVRR